MAVFYKCSIGCDLWLKRCTDCNCNQWIIAKPITIPPTRKKVDNMKNKEFYADRIIETFINDSEQCELKRELLSVKTCDQMSTCEECRKQIEEFLESEYTERIDWKRVPKDTPLRIEYYNGVIIRHFSHYDELANIIYCFAFGTTSLTFEKTTGYPLDGVDISFYYESDKEKYTI